MRHLILGLLLCSAPALCHAQDARAPRTTTPLAVEHTPRNETTEGTLVLSFRVPAIDTVGQIVVRYRPHVKPAYGEIIAHRVVDQGPDAWIAEIPESAILPPSVDYYVVARAPGRPDVPVFASARYPHPVVVVETNAHWHEHEELRLANGHRSRVSALGEWIDYGNWMRCPPGTFPCDPAITQNNIDRYFHTEISYAYGMLGVVEWLRFSVGVLRGNFGLESDTNNAVGLYSGAAEITWYAVPWFRVKTQLILGISNNGFAGGGSGAIIFGRDGDTQLTLAGSGVTGIGPTGAPAHVGATGSVRLSWASIPRVPMAGIVEVSTMPAGDRAGVRLLVEVGYEIEPGTVIKIWGGYQARTQVVGGPTIGAEVVVGL